MGIYVAEGLAMWALEISNPESFHIVGPFFILT
jgi:hypothetical protein